MRGCDLFVTYGPTPSDPLTSAYHQVVDKQDEGNKRTMTTRCGEVIVDDMAASGGPARQVETAEKPADYCADCAALEPKAK